MATKKTTIKIKNGAISAILGVVAIIAIVCVIAFAKGFFSVSSDPYAGLDQSKDDGMEFTKMDVTIDWNDDHSCIVTQDFTVQFNATSRGMYIDIPVNSGEKVRDLTVDLKDNYDLTCDVQHSNKNQLVTVTLAKPDVNGFAGHFSINDTMSCTVKYKYITPNHKLGKDVLALMAIGEGWSCEIRNATVTLNYPAVPDFSGDYGIWVGGVKKSLSNNDVVQSNNGKTVKVTIGYLDAFKGVEIACKMPDGTLKTYVSNEYVATLIIGIVVVVLAILAKLVFGKNMPLTPIVGYYPPRADEQDDGNSNSDYRIKYLSPAQLGKIIDDECSSEDAASMIFYWASNGYLDIDERAKNDLYLIKNRDIDGVRAAEETLFNSLFRNANTRDDGRKEVSLDSLKDDAGIKFAEFANKINAEGGVRYKNKDVVAYKKFPVVSIVLTAIVALISVVYYVFGTYYRGLVSGFDSLFSLNYFYAIAAIIPPVVAAMIGMKWFKYYHKFTPAKRNAVFVAYCLFTVILTFCSTVVIPQDMMFLSERIILTLTMSIASIIAPLVRKRSDEYTMLLNEVIGFRNFLRDVEKDKLETLIDEDPKYFYTILPYANVLGVSDVWEEKIKDITVVPPEYYHSVNASSVFVTLAYVAAFEQICSKMKKVISHSGSSKSSHHGRGGRGGFGGGSFGGGGGGRLR